MKKPIREMLEGSLTDKERDDLLEIEDGEYAAWMLGRADLLKSITQNIKENRDGKKPQE